MFKVLLKPRVEADAIEVMLERIAQAPQDCHNAHLDGDCVEVELVGLRAGEGRLRIAGRVHPFVVTRRQNTLHIWADGKTHQLTIADRSPQRATGAAAAEHRNELKAPMPGTILKILVSPGARFEAHQALIVMESMKMEATISAGHAGRIGSLACEVGQIVEMGARLATLEPEEDDEAA